MSSSRSRLWPLNQITPLVFDPLQCQVELDELDDLLAQNPILTERGQILPFFRRRPHLAALAGSYSHNVRSYDRLAFELTLISDFTADVVVGDSRRESFCFIEFEDGHPNSIFKNTGRRTLEWAPRFDHGASQIIDWFWKLNAQERTVDFQRLFGSLSIAASGLLVVGRDSGVTAADRPRLKWRRERVAVNSQQLHCCTFDELARDLRDSLNTYRAIASLPALP